MKFSAIEKRDLLKGWVAVSIAFGIVLTSNLRSTELLINIGVAALTVGLAFILHEMAHKYFAQKYHCWAEFRSFDLMLVIAIVMSFFGFIFAAPGAVVIQGHITKKQNGIISAAGPAMNLILAALLLPAFFFTSEGLLHQSLFYAFYINAFLAIFNILPIFFFDGKKIWDWNKWVWGIMFLLGAGFIAVTFIV